MSFLKKKAVLLKINNYKTIFLLQCCRGCTVGCVMELLFSQIKSSKVTGRE
jgi:hypothetical protein